MMYGECDPRSTIRVLINPPGLNIQRMSESARRALAILLVILFILSMAVSFIIAILGGNA